MIAQTPVERALYDGSRKFRRDYASDLDAVRREGLEDGRQVVRAEGQVFGQIRMLQQMLSEPESSDRELDLITLEEGEHLLRDLNSRIPGAL